MRDTTDMKLKSLFTVPSTSILVTMDVNSLYTNIDQEEGSDACYKKLETHKNKSAPSKTLKDCILLILKSNISVLWYSSSTKKGDMGSPVATNYVNLFMRIFETSLQNKFYKKKQKKKLGKKLLTLQHFILDMFFVWTDGEDSLKEFLAYSPEMPWNKECEVSHKIWNITIYQNNQLLNVCITLNQ